MAVGGGGAEEEESLVTRFLNPILLVFHCVRKLLHK